jgi:hypothetical protein
MAVFLALFPSISCCYGSGRSGDLAAAKTRADDRNGPASDEFHDVAISFGVADASGLATALRLHFANDSLTEVGLMLAIAAVR